MSSVKHCCVPGCKDSGGMHSVLHGFPKPEKYRVRSSTWLYSIISDILSVPTLFLPAPQSHLQLMSTTTNIIENTIQKENIGSRYSSNEGLYLVVDEVGNFQLPRYEAAFEVVRAWECGYAGNLET